MKYILINVILLLIRIYQYSISILILSSCRFYPSCSEYAYQAIKTCNFLLAIKLIIFRILRCNPLCNGGFDPIPPKKINSKTN